MAQTYSSLTVALDGYYSEEDLRTLINAIQTLKMVSAATPKEVSDKWAAEVNVKLAVKHKLIKLIDEL